MVTRRAGASTLGCLVLLLIVAALAYFAVNVGEVYWRSYQFGDAMRQEARFAARNSDDIIRGRLRAKADSLGLPEGAQHIRIRRSPHHISIWTEYYDNVELPLVVKEVYFNPQAETSF